MIFLNLNFLKKIAIDSRLHKNQRGMSVIPVLISLAIVSSLAFLVITLMETLQKKQAQNNAINTILTLKKTIETTVSDGSGWARTVASASNTNLDCLKTWAFCTNVPDVPANSTSADVLAKASPADILNINELRDANDQLLVRAIAGDGQGFTDKGVRCNTWSAAGNDACPIRYELRTSLLCPFTIAPARQATCNNPTIEFFGVLRYSPNPDNPLIGLINVDKYLIRMVRGTGANSKSEKYTLQKVLVNLGTGGGNCPVAWGASSVVTGFTVFGVNEVTPAPPATDGTSMFLTPGTYSCSASSTCFACSFLNSRLILIDGVSGGVVLRNSPTTSAPYPHMGQAVIPTVTFTLNKPSALQLQQTCSSFPPGVDANFPASTLQSYGMGMALPDYTGTVAATINCTKIF
jgi:Tfp pilus assembly major pilin PilA